MRKLVLCTAIGMMTLAGVAACDDGPNEPRTTTFVSVMTGANERPTANTSTATGTATYVLSGNTLTYTITVNGLSAPVTGAHIHVGNSTVAGPVIFPFAPAQVQTGTLATGSIDLSGPINPSNASSISGDSLRVLLDNGNAYTNVHTSNFVGGEIRGQIVRQ